jgi:hypothetical protein
MSDQQPTRASAYQLVPGNSINDARLAAFGAAVWPGRSTDRVLSSWWRRAGPDDAVAALEKSTGAVAALCAGRPSQWVIGGRRHPAVAICDWYVAPGHAGRLIGRRLIRRFEAPDRLIYAFSMSDDAVAYLARLGWVGPYSAHFMVLALPTLATLVNGMRGRPDGIDFQDQEAGAGPLPPALGRDLDHIEAARGADAHMWRGASEWSWRLSLCGERRYTFSMAWSEGLPVGYVAVRRLRAGSSRLLGRLSGAIVTDLAAANDDPAVLRALAGRAARLAGTLGATVALAATTSMAQRRALAAMGFLSPGLPLLGRMLRRRAPQFMWLPRGPGAGLAPDRVAMSFADSDVDLKL